MRFAPGIAVIVFLAALALHLLAPPSAESKGTVVRAPAELKSADCMPGSRPRLGTEPRMERFYSDQEVLVIGCGPTSGEAKALVAVERERHGLVCSYMALEGRWDADPRCLTVNPETDAACSPGWSSPTAGTTASTYSARRGSGEEGPSTSPVRPPPASPPWLRPTGCRRARPASGLPTYCRSGRRSRAASARPVRSPTSSLRYPPGPIPVAGSRSRAAMGVASQSTANRSSASHGRIGRPLSFYPARTGAARIRCEARSQS